MKLSEAKICFAAIFRNESANVYRCLDGLKEIISCISICDTGSEDDTVNLIEKWGSENDVPTKVHFEEFKNFGYNRTRFFEMAKESFPDSDYCLLVDADMILVLEDGWKDIDVTKDRYYFNQKNPSIVYRNTRLIKTSIDWKCIGVTHEYWDANNPSTEEIGPLIWIDDRNDGGHKHDKFERDERLLRAGLDDPNEPEHVKRRYTYYLGQTLQSLGKNPQAISYFRKRIELDGWPEEVFYSQMQIGTCYEKMGDEERAAGAYLEAWSKRPTRAEPLYKLANMYRKKGKNELGLVFAMRGKKIFQPNDGLFVDYNVYKWGFDEEISICAYYVENYRHKGKRSIIKLLKMGDDVPKHVRDLAISNAKHYGVDPDMVD